MRSNKELVEELVRLGVVCSESVKSAFLSVDRALFVPRSLQADAYLNRPLPIGEGQTISQPLTVALMLEDLSVEEGMRVLDVGCGSGYTTALLSKLVGESGVVVGVELVEELVRLGRSNLAAAGVSARIQRAGSFLGLPQEAPFERVLVSAAARSVPEELVEQLVIDGLMVLPVRSSVLTLQRGEESYQVVRRRRGFRFVPLVEE